jgi:choline dehydrogenase
VRQAAGGSGEPFDTIIAGAGSAGCAIAARLSENPARRVCLIEAGPDYGPYCDGRWPADILDASVDAIESHDWGFPGGVSSSRARIVGGCSAHNGCGIVWPAPADLAEWVDAGLPAWSYDELLPHLQRAEHQLRTRPSRLADLEPWRRATYDAALELGFPELPDINHPSATEGVGPLPVNAVGAVRWNTAFAYLDPARNRPNLTILPGLHIDRLLIQRDHVRGVIGRSNAQTVAVESRHVVLSAGAYGTPAILLRSGIGPLPELERLRIRPVLALPGVGAGLTDHPTIDVPFPPSERLEQSTARHSSTQGPAAQCLLKARSPTGDGPAWDLILGPWTAPAPPSSRRAVDHAAILVTLSKPSSRGCVRLRSADPEVLPEIEHAFLADPAQRDLELMREGIELAVELSRTRAAKPWIQSQASLVTPTARKQFANWAHKAVFGNYHPCCTCRMGPASDPHAVVDPFGRLYGLENLTVADASIFPTSPRANIHLTVVAVGERIARELTDC